VHPDESEKRNDVIDFLIDGMQKWTDVEQDDGTFKKQAVFDPEIAWYKGHIINQPFGRHALLIKQTENLADQAQFFMTPERANVIKHGLIQIVESYKRSIDAKSSETWKDKNNTQSALIHILSKNKQEKLYTIKGDAKKSFLDGIMGREGEDNKEDN